MKETIEFDIRFSEASDLKYLNQWFENDEELENFPFGPKEKEAALKNWIGFSKFKASLTGIIQEEPCAVGTLFLMPYRKVSHHCSFYLMVDPQKRDKGIGSSMVKNLMHLAKTRFRLESLQVEVFDGTKLIPILKKQGFQEVFRQENFAKVDHKKKARIVWEAFL